MQQFDVGLILLQPLYDFCILIVPPLLPLHLWYQFAHHGILIVFRLLLRLNWEVIRKRIFNLFTEVLSRKLALLKQLLANGTLRLLVLQEKMHQLLIATSFAIRHFLHGTTPAEGYSWTAIGVSTFQINLS